MKSTPKSNKPPLSRGVSFPMSLFHTPSSNRNASQSTPETAATTPATPLSSASSPDLRDHSDDGYLGELEEYRVRTLFREELHQHSQTPRNSFSSRRSRRQHAFQKGACSFDTSESNSQGGVSRRSKSRSRSSSNGSKFKDFDSSPSTSTEPTSSDSSPDRPYFIRKKRPLSPLFLTEDPHIRCKSRHQRGLLAVLGFVVLCSVVMVCWSNQSMEDEMVLKYEQEIRDKVQGRHKGNAAAGLRGGLVRMAGRRFERFRGSADKQDRGDKKNKRKKKRGKEKTEDDFKSSGMLKFSPPPPLSAQGPAFESQDRAMYKKEKPSKSGAPRTLFLGLHSRAVTDRSVLNFPADFTDNTQYYGVFDSDDERLSHMEVREPLASEECVPMQDWQTTFHPSCNGMHEMAMDQMGDSSRTTDFSLFGVKGFWRNAWKVDTLGNDNEQETFVLKTLKFNHNFEDAHFEHDRVDAVAMERLTSSPHVINIFGFCGHSVVTEYADGSRVGELADKAKRKPLERLRIARDIAMGLADVHGIDGDGNATFVHLDINPANVVSIGGTLKLNDFNIGILLRWNTTSNTQCGFPAQYPNPQWRSPEEARSEQHLTEKVDVFSMGHIFFRLICGHEPWNKLEDGGKPTKDEINEKVQKGILPRMPEEIESTNDPEVGSIRDAMLACYRPDPKQRPSARTIANELQHVLETLEKQAESTE